MTMPMAKTSTHPRRLWQSMAAVLMGFVAIVVLSLGTDQVLHVLGAPGRAVGSAACRCAPALTADKEKKLRPVK